MFEILYEHSYVFLETNLEHDVSLHWIQKQRQTYLTYQMVHKGLQSFH